MDDCTILLLVKHRDLFTLRWMWHANKIGLPWPILIADGGDNPVSRRVLADSANFPNIKYQYVQYNDASILEYYGKVVDAANRVSTEYVCRIANDDFILPSGLEQVLGHLRGDSGLAWASANLGTFSVHQAGGGDLPMLGDLYRMVLDVRPDMYTDDDAMARIRKFFQAFELQIYFAAFRTANFRELYRTKQEQNLVNLDLADVMKTVQSLTQGRHKVDSRSIVYVCQTDTSQVHRFQPKLPEKLVRQGYMQEVEAVIRDLRGLFDTDAAKADIEEEVRSHFQRVFTRKFAGSAPPRLRHFPLAIKELAPARRLRLALDLRRLRNGLAGLGAGPELLAAQLADITAVRDTLEGSGFVEFLRRVAPEAATP